MSRANCIQRLSLSLLLAVTVHAGERSVAPELNHFAAGSYRELARGSGNLVFSPFSISTVISMALSGARGQTAKEMAGALNLTYPDSSYDAALASLVEQITKAANGGGSELLNANGLWVERAFPILPDFRQTLAAVYRAPLRQLSFAQAEAARAEINSWTDEHTKGRIRELFGPGSLNADTQLVLTAATYFHGTWQTQFQPRQTHAAPFRLGSGGTAQANFMNQTGEFGYAEAPDVRVLEMKYAGTGLAFDILLPKTDGGLADLERSLTPEVMTARLGALHEQKVEVAVPKFRAESEFSLRGVLSGMGMRTAFTGSADFSGIDDRRDLMLSDLRHKAFVEVSEEGTEAAAATGAVVQMIAMPAPPVQFRADHPFVFVIRDTRSGLILFEGRLVKP
jgi:serpin B